MVRRGISCEVGWGLGGAEEISAEAAPVRLATFFKPMMAATVAVETSI